MQNNLTMLHQEFQQKHLQLSKITDKIDTFMQIYRSKSNVNQFNAKEKIKTLKNQFIDLKSEFKVLQTDLAIYSQLPHQFVRMVVELPKMYQKFWENSEQQLINKLYKKQQQCKSLYEKLQIIQDENEQLKKKIQDSQMKNCSIVIKQCDDSLTQDFFKAQKISPKYQKASEELDSYIQNMEITIRESQDYLFKKITQQVSQEEQDSYERSQINKQFLEINTTRPLYHDISQQINVEPNRKKSQPNIFPQRNSKQKLKGKRNMNKIQDTANKSHFWTKFSEHTGSSRNKYSKNKPKKDYSQSKQNISGCDNKLINKLSTIQKKTLMSKISDFRTMLFLEKGIQRFGFNVENRK